MVLVSLFNKKFGRASADILRLEECWKYDAKFSKVHREKILVGTVLRKLIAKIPNECTATCLMTKGCKSFNMRRSDLFCELNSDDSRGEGVTVEKKSGWDLFETSDVEKNVRCYVMSTLCL